MHPTSPEYKEAIYPGVEGSREVTARITFDISDVTAAEDVTSIATTTELANVSQKSQINNNVREAKTNLATLEKDRFRLDGSFSFADDVVPANNGEVGFVSSVLCDAAGVFTTPQTITINFGTTHSSAGLTVTFDALNNEYATDFNLSAYNTSGGLIDSKNVTGNTETMRAFLGQFLNYKKIVLTITKWNVGNRRARVLELDFGFLSVYNDDQLISCSLIEEMDMTSGQLPSPEFRFTVDNSDRAFNILNPTGFYKYLQQRQQVIAELGVVLPSGKVEYVPLGNYLLWEWASEQGSLTASFTTRTNLDLMANYEYENLGNVNQSLYQYAFNIFAYCKITNYWLDPALQTIMTNSIHKKTDCRTILQMIAIAGRCNIYVTRENVITLKRTVFKDISATVWTDDDLGDTWEV